MYVSLSKVSCNLMVVRLVTVEVVAEAGKVDTAVVESGAVEMVAKMHNLPLVESPSYLRTSLAKKRCRV